MTTFKSQLFLSKTTLLPSFDTIINNVEYLRNNLKNVYTSFVIVVNSE